MGHITTNVFFLLFNIFVCMFVIFIGTSLIFLYSIMSKNSKKSFMLLFGIFTIMAGLWCLSETQLSQVLSINSVYFENAQNVILMLLPIPFLLFLVNIYQLKAKKILYFLCASHFVVFISTFLAQFWVDINTILQFDITVILLAITVITVIGVNITEGSYAKKRKLHNLDIGSFVMCLGSLLSIISYSLNYRVYHSIYFLYGLLIYCVLLMRYFIIYFGKMFAKNAKIELLEQMAYTDMHSGFFNFNRFDSDLKERYIDLKPPYTLSIAVMNLNNLQLISQIKGRKEAEIQIDALIKCIKESFTGCENIYRTDQQEFVIICENLAKEAPEEFLNVFADKINIENEKLSTKLSVAYAMLYFDEFTDKTAEDLFIRAETAMYKHKIKSKRKFNDKHLNDIVPSA